VLVESTEASVEANIYYLETTQRRELRINLQVEVSNLQVAQHQPFKVCTLLQFFGRPSDALELLASTGEIGIFKCTQLFLTVDLLYRDDPSGLLRHSIISKHALILRPYALHLSADQRCAPQVSPACYYRFLSGFSDLLLPSLRRLIRR